MISMMRTAIYAGSFDPVTNGHLDIIERAANMFDSLTVGIAVNSSKEPLFTLEERKYIIAKVTEHIPNIKIDVFNGLLADYVNKHSFDTVVRGLRATTDFEYEIQMAQMNARLYTGGTETVFLMTDPRYSFISSSLITEVVSYGEEILSNASKVPFSEKAIVDSDEIRSIVDDIRLSMPKDIQQAKWVKDEQDRILNEARSEYDKVIVAAKKQAEYLVENDIIKKEAEKRADALISEAENHSRYIKLRSYEYVDKLLYDMQNDIAKVATEFIQPMNDYFTDMVGEMNNRVNGNRQEMKALAERVQGGSTYTEEQQTADEHAEGVEE